MARSAADVFDARPCLACAALSDDEVIQQFGGELEYVAQHTPYEVGIINGQCRRCMSRNIRPLPGPQTKFLATKATLAIYGGSAGGGKTLGLLLSWLRHANTRGAAGLIARNTGVDMTRPGGLWGEAQRVFAGTGPACYRSTCWPTPRPNCAVCHGTGTADVSFVKAPNMRVSWPGGGTLEFAHLADGGTIRLQSTNFAWIGVEEAVECELDAIVFLLTRLRSLSGVTPAMRMTTNPDPDHGLRAWIEPYLTNDGYPDTDKSGAIRYLAREANADRFVTAATPQEAQALAGNHDVDPISYTYIPAFLEDNLALEAVDPGFKDYNAKLGIQTTAKREQLRRGNWFIREQRHGMLGRSRWGGESISLTEPLDPIVMRIRAWDKAATEPRTNYPNPDYTAGIMVEWDAVGRWYVSDLVACRKDTPGVDKLMADTAWHDGTGVYQVHEVEPGAAGKSDETHTRMVLRSRFVANTAAGVDVIGPRVYARHAETDKIVKLQPVARELELGMASIPRFASGEQWEPRGYILERPDNQWCSRAYSDKGPHPVTLGELFWAHIELFFTKGKKDDVADALGIAHKHRNRIEQERKKAAENRPIRRVLRFVQK